VATLRTKKRSGVLGAQQGVIDGVARALRHDSSAPTPLRRLVAGLPRSPPRPCPRECHRRNHASAAGEAHSGSRDDAHVLSVATSGYLHRIFVCRLCEATRDGSAGARTHLDGRSGRRSHRGAATRTMSQIGQKRRHHLFQRLTGNVQLATVALVPSELRRPTLDGERDGSSSASRSPSPHHQPLRATSAGP